MRFLALCLIATSMLGGCCGNDECADENLFTLQVSIPYAKTDSLRNRRSWPGQGVLDVYDSASGRIIDRFSQYITFASCWGDNGLQPCDTLHVDVTFRTPSVQEYLYNHPLALVVRLDSLRRRDTLTSVHFYPGFKEVKRDNLLCKGCKGQYLMPRRLTYQYKKGSGEATRHTKIGDGLMVVSLKP